jgi:hypothetical protein
MNEDNIVICIDNSKEIMLHETINRTALTTNKGYKIISKQQYTTTNNFYNTFSIINNEGINASYRSERFITLQQWRQKQLKQLGI